MATSRIRQMASNVYAVSSGSNAEAALVTFGNLDASAQTETGAGSRSDFVPWGANNDQLYRMHKLASESPNKWRLIKTRRDFITGLGVYTHSGEELQGKPTRFKPVKFQDFETWRELVQWDLEFVGFVIQYCFSGNVFVQLTLGLGGQLVAVELIDAFKVRTRKLTAKETKPSAYLVNPNFGAKGYNKKDTVTVPAFDPTNPTKYPTCIVHLKDRIPGQDYYAFAEWWSTEEWTIVANMIPKFHRAGLLNGYNIKYHISIPDDYFDEDIPDELLDGKTQEQAKKELKQKVLGDIGDSLSGVDNADKALFTFHKEGDQSNRLKGVTITPLKNMMSDDAYTKLFATANQVQASGHGVQPTLAGVDTGGKMGGSGKELESAANYQQNFLTYVDRLILLRVLYIAKQINGWPAELQFDVRNIAMYTPDVTPTGAAANPNTKSGKKQKDDDPEEEQDPAETEETDE